MAIVEIPSGTLIEDETGGFKGIVECIGVDFSGKPALLLRELQISVEVVEKQIYEYYLNLEMLMVGDLRMAERRLRKRIASLINVPEENALSNYNLVKFAEKDGTLDRFSKTKVFPKEEYYICPLNQITIDSAKKLKIKNARSLIKIDSNQALTDDSIACYFVGFCNPPTILFAKSSDVEIGKINDEIRKIENYKEKLEEEKEKGKISEKVYEKLRSEYDEKLEKLIKQVEEMKMRYFVHQDKNAGNSV